VDPYKETLNRMKKIFPKSVVISTSEILEAQPVLTGLVDSLYLRAIPVTTEAKNHKRFTEIGAVNLQGYVPAMVRSRKMNAWVNLLLQHKEAFPLMTEVLNQKFPERRDLGPTT